jgi:hypothetical protein
MPQALRPRAQRFSLQMPMSFRVLGESEWRDALTANVSRTGVLFLTESNLAPDTKLEMKLTLPASIAGQAAGEVLARGRVVRTLAGDPLRPQPAVAATIGSFKLAPQGAPSGGQDV